MASHGHNHTVDPQDLYYNQVDTDHAHYALLGLGGFAALALIWTTASRLSCYLRQITCLSNERQQYFVPAHKWLATARKHFLYAPLLGTRHHREFRLSRAVHMGTLPSRSHASILVGILAMNVALCTVNVPYDTHRTADVIRNRTGTMATVNLIPLVLMAGRNNPLIRLLRVPYDTFNLCHRWLARVVVLEALAHVFAWCIPKVRDGGWDAASCAFVFLFIHSPSPIRHAFYETFLHLHICIAAMSFIFLWIHLDGRRARHFLLGAIVLWATERAARMFTILYRNVSRVPTTAVIECLTDDNDILRIALYLPRPWTVSPGQHLYLYIPSISLWCSHPFSICWSSEEHNSLEDTSTRADTDENNPHKPKTQKQIYMLIQRRKGFTNTLARRVGRRANKTLSVHALVEGPYGGIHSLDSYGTVVLFAAGVGITHHLLYLRRLVRGQVAGTVAARRITLVWAVRSAGYVEWVEDWIGSIMGTHKGKEKEEGVSLARVFRILLYITGSCDTVAMRNLGVGGQGEYQVFRGRPRLGEVLAGEVDNQIGAMGVLCCGNGSFSDDVRQVCREAQSRSRVDFLEESFSW
ncbi:hypothetical protein BJX99DRAFT_270714 [Aspergillus californicus]